MADNNNQEPGLVGSHAQYVKGAAEVSQPTRTIQCDLSLIESQAAIGDLSGSHAWKSSGEQDKAAGLSAMRQAGEQRDATQGYGRVEELAGKATGCEGMQKEGAASNKE